MITDFAKMMTGLVVRGGLGLPLRATAFAAMVWGVWVFVPLFWGWTRTVGYSPDDGDVLAGLLLAGPAIGAVLALMRGLDGRLKERYLRNSGYIREPWGLWDFLRRAPFACWCVVTDDGNDVPVWAILSWPAIATADFVLAVGTLVAVPCWWLWLATAAVWRQAWRVLNIRPLNSKSKCE